MASILALLPVLLQFSTLAPEIIAEAKAIFASFAPNQTAVTPEQEQAIWDLLTKINAQEQAS